MRFLPGEVEIEMRMLPAERATRQSRPNLKPLRAQRSKLFLERAFTRQEHERICLGIIPERMEDKSFMFVEDNTLYVHRRERQLIASMLCSLLESRCRWCLRSDTCPRHCLRLGINGEGGLVHAPAI